MKMIVSSCYEIRQKLLNRDLKKKLNMALSASYFGEKSSYYFLNAENA